MEKKYFSIWGKQKTPVIHPGFLHFVRMEGLEPPRREAPDPKSGAATNYATCASYVRRTNKRDANINYFLLK